MPLKQVIAWIAVYVSLVFMLFSAIFTTYTTGIFLVHSIQRTRRKYARNTQRVD